MDGKKCKECGKPLPKRRSKFCSDYCGSKWRRESRALNLVEIECEYCGRLFKPWGQKSRFCGKRCADTFLEENSTGGDYNRPLESDSPFLIQKWRAEGMTIQELIKITRRSEERIKEALSVRLSAQDYRTMREYFNPKNKTKHKCV